MSVDRYCVRIGDSYPVAENAPYGEVVARLVEVTVRAVIARCVDESEWEHELLRRRGLGALQIRKNGKAVWEDGPSFEVELAEARREKIDARFSALNELDSQLYRKLDRDLRAWWRRTGYKTPSLRRDMRRLFVELERDVSERASNARYGLLAELLNSHSQETP